MAESLIHYANLPDFMQTVTDGVAKALPANRVILISLDTATEQVTHVARGGVGADYVMRMLPFLNCKKG